MYKVWVGSSDGARSAEFIAEAEAPSLAFVSVAKFLHDNPFYEITPYEGMPLTVKGMAEQENAFHINSRNRHIGALPVMLTYNANQPMEGIEVAQHKIPPDAQAA
jgi:hypothetical protein